MCAGDGMRLFYQPADHPRPNHPAMEFRLPYLTCSVEKYRELGLQCGGPLIDHTFVVVEDHGTELTLAWVT
jgi:hypothetical protein